MPPKISVVIPSLNKSNYIGKTLESIVTQKYKNFEIIIQDGGSTDGTEKIVEMFIKKYPGKIIFESRKDKGQADAINIGFKKASGEILAYINADDIYEDGAFEAVANTHLQERKNWYAGRGRVINNEGREIAKRFISYKNCLLVLNRRVLLLMINYLMQPSVFFTRESYLKHGPFIGSKNFVMEYDFWLKMSSDGMPVVLDKVLSSFRIVPDTITSRSYVLLLSEDEKVVKKYTNNRLLLFLHKLHNLARVLVIKSM